MGHAFSDGEEMLTNSCLKGAALCIIPVATESIISFSRSFQELCLS